ncbi:hypothetical protein C8F01DRAFT_1236239 [Mycena amicta]|nr:hypothetical protein C8F01DRAFT_1236239 [Mycena amicta]
MSLYEFMFSHSHLLQPWFIDADTGTKTTGTMIKAQVDALALGLQCVWGIGKYSSVLEAHLEYGIHDVVAVVSQNSPNFGTMLWACHKVGATVACVSATGTVGELRSLDVVLTAAEQCGIGLDHIAVEGANSTMFFNRYEAQGLLSLTQLIDRGKELYPAAETIPAILFTPSPIAFLCFSSGTTGLPKAVVLPHASIIANLEQLAGSSVPTSRVLVGDRALGVIPFYHIFGLVTLVHLCPTLGVATVVFSSLPPFAVFLEKMTCFRINHLFLAPPLVNAFVKHPAVKCVDLTFMKSAMIAAAPLSAAVETAFTAVGGNEFLVTQVFGMTECGGMITGLSDGARATPGSVATPMVQTEVKIVDDTGAPIPRGCGHRGQLCVRGPQLCQGYMGNRVATQEAFDADGYLYTGDVAEISEDGNIWIVDRVKCLIKTKGYQVSPAELEAELLQLDCVDDVAVAGKPHERHGEVPVAFVVLSDAGKNLNGDVQQTIKHAIYATKSEYKWLHEVRFLDVIPRLPSGKVHAARLRSMLVD